MSLSSLSQRWDQENPPRASRVLSGSSPVLCVACKADTLFCSSTAPAWALTDGPWPADSGVFWKKKGYTSSAFSNNRGSSVACRLFGFRKNIDGVWDECMTKEERVGLQCQICTLLENLPCAVSSAEWQRADKFQIYQFLRRAFVCRQQE